MQNDHDYWFLAADRIRRLRQEALGNHLMDDRLRALLRKVWMWVRRRWHRRSGRAAAPRVPTPGACNC